MGARLVGMAVQMVIGTSAGRTPALPAYESDFYLVTVYEVMPRSPIIRGRAGDSSTHKRHPQRDAQWAEVLVVDLSIPFVIPHVQDLGSFYRKAQVSQRKKRMATDLPGDTKAQLTPDLRSATETVPNSITWEAWTEKGKASSRPPWWLLLLGIVTLSVIYWLWGRGPGVAL